MSFDKDIIEFGLFVAVGLICWAWSKKRGLTDYGYQPVQIFDLLYLVFILVFIGALDLLLNPLIRSMVSDSSSARILVGKLPDIVQFAFFILTIDFVGYWIHRLLHGRIFWRFHATHHSVKSLNWISGMRGSPVHTLIVLVPSMSIAGFFLPNPAPWMFIAAICFDVISQHIGHSSIKFPFEKQLEYFLVTPRLHFVHHHPNSYYTDSNYGFYFSVWDRIFGTYRDPEMIPNDQKGMLGLDYEESMFSLFIGLDRRTYKSANSTFAKEKF